MDPLLFSLKDGACTCFNKNLKCSPPNLTEMLWHDLKLGFQLRHSRNIDEPKQVYRRKISPQRNIRNI